MKIDTGIAEALRERITAGLARLLADSYLLLVKTHGFHWNVTGPQFTSLHAMFMTQYTELQTAVDEIAERIRALGVVAPGSYAQFAQLASIPEEPGAPSADVMVRQLVGDHEALARAIRDLLPIAAEGKDEASVDLLVGRLGLHEKTAWMLRSLVG